MSLTFRPIPVLAGQNMFVPLGLNNSGWSPITLFLAGTVTAALTFACTATYARKERVTGYLTPREGMTRVMTTRPGILKELYVKNGDLVTEGAPLFTVDTSHALTGGGTLDAAVADGLQRQITLLDEQIAAEETRAQSEADRLSTRIQGLATELSSMETQRQLQVERTSVTEARLKALSELRAKGFVSEAEYRAREEAWLSQRQSLAAIDQRMTALSVDLAQTRIERDRAPLDSADRLSRLSSSQTELRQRLAETKAQHSQLVRAARTGQVTSLQATAGHYLDPAKPVLTLIPQGAVLNAELSVPSRAIGFVEPGQPVRLMYDAFPYQYFGMHDGVIDTVSQAILTPNEFIGPIKPNEPSYIVSVIIKSEVINAYGKSIPLHADMTVRAEIVLERRNIGTLLTDMMNLRSFFDR